MMNNLIDKIESEEKSEFSEVVIVLPNEDINSQIIKIKEKMNDSDTLNIDPYYTPFFIFCSPNNVDLNGFISSKTFYYKIKSEGSLNIKINQIIDIKENEEENKKIDLNDGYKLYNKLNRLFSYYNELGDNFSFMNSDNKEVNIQLENVNNITVFLNILMVGRTGSGKSTLINLLLDEKKSLEGGSGLSTTSKDIKVYTKTNVPLRLYDAKGFENEKTVQNFINIFDNYSGRLAAAKDSLNAVFYCMEYKTKGTYVEAMEIPIYQKLVKLRIPILFIITKCQFIPEEERNNEGEKLKENDINKKEDDNDKEIKKARKNEINKIQKTIKNEIKKIFIDINKKEINKEDADKFIKDYVHIYFVNLVKTKTSGLKPFGLDKLLSFFTKNVTQKSWKDLEKSCEEGNEENCKKYCKNNPFLKVYSEFNELNARNKAESLRYLKGLKAGAFFSGWVPGVDIGMEYYYRYLFEKKLKQLYGFNYKEAEISISRNNSVSIDNENNSEIEVVNNRTPRGYSMQMDNINNNSIIEPTDQRSNSVNISNNMKKQEKKIDKHIDNQVSNKIRNVSAITGAIGEAGELFVGISGEIILEVGAQTLCFALLPITCIVFGALSCYNIHKDCKTMLNIYEKAFTPLKFKTLLSYIQSFQEAIKYLKKISKKFAQDKNDDRN